jgi:hypothetical protein
MRLRNSAPNPSSPLCELSIMGACSGMSTMLAVTLSMTSPYVVRMLPYFLSTRTHHILIGVKGAATVTDSAVISMMGRSVTFLVLRTGSTIDR